MTYLDYIVFFEKCDQQQPSGFSGNATRLYLKLLHLANVLANGGPWPAEFSKSDPYVAAVAGMVPNTMKKCRDELVAGGLLEGSWGEKGQGRLGVYRLLGPDSKLAKIDSLPDEKPSNSDSLPTDKLANFDSLQARKVANSDSLPPENGEKPAGKLSNFDTLIKEEERESSSAAVAAPALASSSVEQSTLPASPTKSVRKSPKKVGATLAEVAALPLPFAGAEFAEAWRTFYTDNTKQVAAGKPLSAFVLMLKKLARRESEAFAIAMLEAAIQGNWSGIENGGTDRLYLEWQAEQARRPPPVTTPAPTLASPTAHDELFGLTRSAADGLAAARDTPEYRAYQARQQAAAPATA